MPYFGDQWFNVVKSFNVYEPFYEGVDAEYREWRAESDRARDWRKREARKTWQPSFTFPALRRQ